jgi:hypothetical protein
MTSTGLTTLRHPARPRSRSVRPDRLLRGSALAALVAFAGVWVATGPPPATDAPARVALVADAGANPEATLATARAWAARAERRGGVEAAVRVPRTAREAATDVRYFAAQGYATVVAAGPHARAAAARVSADERHPGTRFEPRPAAAR